MENITRRAFVSGTLATLLLAACGKKDDKPEEPAATLGGWEAVAAAESLLDDDAQAIFDLAAEAGELDGTGVAELARQVVSGTNHAFLAFSPTASRWDIVVAYEDLQGAVSVLSTAEIDPADLHVTDADETEGMVGAWEVLEQAGTTLVPSEAQDAFDAAMGAHVGVDLKPIACLATQLVSGTNYLVLCGGAPVVADPKPSLYLATVYADLDGNAEFTSVETLDLLANIGQ